jgi:hypothetical protein
MAGHSPEKYDIFVSYAREDAARIRPLVLALEAEGWTTFWDRKIPPAESWRSYIGLRLRSASVVIVAWSEYSIQSDWVITEAEDAHKRRALVPTLIDAVEPPLGLNHIQAADLVEWLGRTGGTLPKDLRTAIQRKISASGERIRSATSRASIESMSVRLPGVGSSAPDTSNTPILPPDFDPLAPNDDPFKKPTKPDHAPRLTSAPRPPKPAAPIPDDWDVGPQVLDTSNTPILPPDFDPLAPNDDPFKEPTKPDHAPTLTSAPRPPKPAAPIPDDWDVGPQAAPPSQMPKEPPAQPSPPQCPAPPPATIIPDDWDGLSTKPILPR